MTISGVFKSNSIYINYSFTLRIGKPLVVVFSGVDSIPGRCLSSYYGYQKTLNSSVLHVIDNFGAHGNYLLSIARDFSIRQAVCDLIKIIQLDANVDLSNTYFIGTSKGATSAICYSLLLGGGTVIGGEPQVLLGDFLYNENWRENNELQAIAYVMCGRLDERDKLYLNGMLIDIFVGNGKDYKGQIYIYYGKTTGYHWRHIRHLPDILERSNISDTIIKFKEFDIAHHNEIIPIFQQSVGEFGL
jgi:hypothetical protein